MQQPSSTHPTSIERPIQFPRQRRKRHLSFWQRTLTVIAITTLLGVVIGALIYTRAFSIGSAHAEARTDASPIAQLWQEMNGESSVDEQEVTAGSSLFQVNTLQQATVEATSTADPFRQANPTAVGTAAEETNAQRVTEGASVVIEERPELERAYRLAEQAIEFDDPRQAMESLLVLSQNHPDYRADDVMNLLYRAYLAVGDLVMRDGEQRDAIDFYERAEQLAVADKSALIRRQQAIERFLSGTTAIEEGTEDTIATVTILEEGSSEAEAAASTTTTAPPPAPIARVARVPVQCPDDHITITAPAVNEVLSGYATVMGSVSIEDLWFYKVEWAAAGSSEFAYFAGQGNAISQGALGTLDTRILANGDYLLRVTVVDDTGNYPPPCDLPVTIRN